MMKNKILKVMLSSVIAFSLLFALMSVSLAAGTPSITVDRDDQSVTLTGSGFEDGQEVAILVLNDGVDSPEDIDLDNPINSIDYIDQVTADNNGEFSFDYTSRANVAVSQTLKIFATGGAEADLVIGDIEGEPVEDTTPPVITLNGDATITLTQGDTFVDPGVTVTDNVDTDLEATVTYDPAGGVDTSVVGTYTIKYDAVDAAGNEAVQVIRTVIVQEAPTSEAVLNVGSTEVDPGEEATVDVVLQNADNLYGFNVKIAYDEAKYDNIEVVGIVDDTTASVTVDDGQIAVAKLSTSSAIADGTIFEIKFTLKDTVEPGSTTGLDVEEAMLAVDPGNDPEDNEAYKVDISENAVDGVITVKSSIVNKTALNALIDEAETLIENTDAGDTPGKYGASEKAALETAKGAAETVMADPNAVQADIDAQVTALGDAITAYKDSKIPGYGVIVGDGDEPSSNDVKELLKYLVDASSLTETQKLSADVNDDGDVDILDALIIARYVAGVISKFPVE